MTKSEWTGFRIMTTLVLVFVLCTHWACENDDKDAELIWNGFHMVWLSDPPLSHRISLLEYIPDENVGVVSGKLETKTTQGLIGGTYSTGSTMSDYPEVGQFYSFVIGSEMAVSYGHEKSFINDQSSPEDTFALSHSLAELGLARYENYSVLLSGFAMDTSTEQAASFPEEYDSSFGYCLKDFGIEVADLVISGDSLDFNLNFLLTWGPTGESIEDREYMDQSIPMARTACSVYYTILGYNGASERGDLSYSLSYKIGAFLEQDHASTEDQLVEVSIPAEYKTAFPVITGFLYENDPIDIEDPHGFYVYSLSVKLYDTDFQDGLCRFYYDGYMSNTGITVNQLAYTFTGQYEVVQLKERASLGNGELNMQYTDGVGSYSESISFPLNE